MYKILIVDDGESIRTGLTVGVDWELLGCEVAGSVPDGSQALACIRQDVPDIVLSDISMEPMNGLDLCAAINEQYPQIKCILLTGFYDFDNACQAIKYGVVELLLKPTSPAKISAAVNRAIGKIKENSLTDILCSEIQHQAIENLALKRSMLLQELKAYCISHQVPFLENYNICLYLLNVCFQQFLSYDIPGFSLNEQYSFSKKLSGCKTIDSMYLLLESTIHLVNSTVEIKPKPSDLIGRVVSYIHANYASVLSLESIAGVFSISAGYLGRLFKSRMSVNLSNYIQQVRIEKAKELIVNTGLHTYEIAEAVGISDPVYFSKLFKKLTGCRVRDYRLEHAKKEP
ncbi:response regulator transcription factor [Agathobaculum sp.]|uniref:response regulator transcription factor n=1 Tax=Agathobaculum sp. TaxID=2048138 RepID=UPI002A80AA3B|nr:response regulator [Agathobaculum sp.]MDY3618365.1 response regulator [Agathobaculum sp.]